LYKLYSYNGINKQLIRTTDNVAEAIEDGIAYNVFVCYLNNISTIDQWMDFLRGSVYHRFYVEIDGGFNWCCPDILGV